MKTFEVVLSKSYIVKIKANNADLAKEFSQYYTSDIIDLSSKKDRNDKNFEIENIDCKVNEVFEVEENNENN